MKMQAMEGDRKGYIGLVWNSQKAAEKRIAATELRAITGALNVKAAAPLPSGLRPALAAPTGIAAPAEDEVGGAVWAAFAAGTTRVVGAVVPGVLDDEGFAEEEEEWEPARQDESVLFWTVTTPLHASSPALSTRETWAGVPAFKSTVQVREVPVLLVPRSARTLSHGFLGSTKMISIAPAEAPLHLMSTGWHWTSWGGVSTENAASAPGRARAETRARETSDLNISFAGLERGIFAESEGSF